MSDSDDGKWVVPALLVLLIVGISTLGLTRPDSSGSPEATMEKWQKSIDGLIGDWFPRDKLNPCNVTPRPTCCTDGRASFTGSCLLAIGECNDTCMRRIDMRTNGSPKVVAKLETVVDGEKHDQELKWSNVGKGRVKTTADLGPQPAVLMLSCTKSCNVDFQ